MNQYSSGNCNDNNQVFKGNIGAVHVCVELIVRLLMGEGRIPVTRIMIAIVTAIVRLTDTAK